MPKAQEKAIQKEKIETWFSKLSEDEQGFFYNLHDFITTNDMMRGFFDRFSDECANISEIMNLPLNKRNELAERLKMHDEKAINASLIEDVAKADLEFHIELAKAAGDDAFVKKWEKLFVKTTGSQHEIWKSIGRKSSHRNALDSAHAKIHSAIGMDDPTDGKEKALLALYRHFATLLFHYHKGFNHRTSENREIEQSPKTKRQPLPQMTGA